MIELRKCAFILELGVITNHLYFPSISPCRPQRGFECSCYKLQKEEILNPRYEYPTALVYNKYHVQICDTGFSGDFESPCCLHRLF
jgi:hypothetical protein